MSLRQLLVGTAMVIGLSAGPASAQVLFDIDISNAPPAPRYEVVPAPRSGYSWAPGYWAWVGHRHVWEPGHWVEARPGYAWHPEHWEQHGHKWRLERGGWDRDPNWHAEAHPVHHGRHAGDANEHHDDHDARDDHDHNWDQGHHWDHDNDRH